MEKEPGVHLLTVSVIQSCLNEHLENLFSITFCIVVDAKAQVQLNNILGAVNAAVGNVAGVIGRVGDDLRRHCHTEQLEKNRFRCMYLQWKARCQRAETKIAGLKAVLTANGLPIPNHLQ